MPRAHQSADHRSPRERQAAIFLGIAAAVAVANLAASVACWNLHRRAADDPILAPASVIFLVCVGIQARLVGGVWRNGRAVGLASALEALYLRPRFWRRIALGLLATYLTTLVLGPLRHAVWLWAAAVSVWYTLLLLPLAAPPRIVDHWRRWSQLRPTRRLAWLVYASSLLLVSSESVLEAYRLAERQAWLGATASPQAGLPELQPFTADSIVARDPRRQFRIAIVADPSTLDSDGRAWLAGIEQSLPGVEIVPVALERGWWSETAGDAWTQVSRVEPDLVLAAIAACEDLTHETPAPSWFDWRQLELARLARLDAAPCEDLAADRGADDFEAFLGRLLARASVCRMPADERLQARWRRAFASLDRLLEGCHNRRVPAALVLVPSHFQVNSALCATLARRMGLSAAQLDVELPQRRLIDFADQRRVPTLDLLPHLRLQREPVYERNALVWNEQGSSTAATTIGAWLETSYGVQPEVAARLSRAQ